MQKQPVGIFDSGFGGLEVFREIEKALPFYDYVYLGDTARAPYGSRSQKEIYKFTSQAVNFLFEKGCVLVILACNTASSEALRKIQQNFSDKKVLGVLIPAAEAAASLTASKKVGVIATQGTINSGAFLRELKKLDQSIVVYPQACPLLVPLIESGQENSKELTLALEGCLKPLMDKKIDTLILGCTHYGLIEDKIRQMVPKEVKIISEGRVVAEKLKDYFKRHSEIESKITRNCSIEFLTTGHLDKFNKIGSRFFKDEIRAQKVDIQQ